ncbi:MAG: hypothetical protein JF886_12195 [Candidatus Dormibacteraeota bacterium]|uniref:HTH-type transcriptional regulator n=2 Tax=Candidatus Aeolococcus gillhamiae TaxID=3127015 RepID=A0A934NAS3_9BACT|nr:hypothetical protein [Candidatus Dormibacteraeota bacterium]
MTMDRVTGIFVEGMGASSATSGILTQLQGRIFGLLYLKDQPLSLDDITDELQQSKSNVSVQIRGLLEWHLVRQVRIVGSRRDHYVAATDFWRVMQEIVERRFRWNLRQVLASTDETERALTSRPGAGRDAFVRERLAALRAYFIAVDTMLEALSHGEATTSDPMRETAAPRHRGARRAR